MNSSFQSDPNSSFQDNSLRFSSPSLNNVNRAPTQQAAPVQANQLTHHHTYNQYPSNQLSTTSVTEQHLWDLANVYYNHAKMNQQKVKSKKNLLEYYSLIQLALLSLRKLLSLSQAVTLRMRLKANLKIAEILINESLDSNSFESEEVQPEYYLDQVVLLTIQNLDYINYTAQAVFLLIQQLLVKGKYKQASKLLSEQNPHFHNLPLFKYLKFKILMNVNSLQALNFIQSFIKSPEFNFLDDNLKLFFLLNESCFSLEKGLQPLAFVDNLPGTSVLQLEVYRQFTSVLNETTLMSSISSSKETNPYPSINSKLRALGAFLTENRLVLYQNAFSLQFPVFNNVQVPVWIHWINYPIMNIIFYLLYGISKLYITFDRRDSLHTFKQCLSLIETELENYNSASSNIKINQQQVEKLLEIKKIVLFYIIIENSIAENINEHTLEGILKEISPSNDTINSLYLKALNFQQKGDLDNAKVHYYSVIKNMESAIDSNYSDIFFISHLNVLAILESQLSYFTRTSNTNKYTSLNQERSSLLEKIHLIQLSKNISLNSKYLFAITFEFLQILYNYSSSSIINQNYQISAIIDANFDNLKRYTMLGSSLLYLKSSTLNQNSDQKQKSSQLSFNLAKMGYMPLLRYVSGLLNGNNAKIARNLQQYEIQKQKLEKIEKNLDKNFFKIFE